MIYRCSIAVKRAEPHGFYPPVHMPETSSKLKRKRDVFEEAEMADFRRVRIKTSIFLPFEGSRPPRSPISNYAGSDSVWRDAASPPLHSFTEVTPVRSRKRPSQGDAVLVSF